MLTIRKQQLAVFGPLGKKSFEDRMSIHLNKSFPGQCQALGEGKLLDTVQYGTQRAASYHIVCERDVCKYIDLMILFGCDFDKDVNLPWAQSVLCNHAFRDPAVKIDRLLKAAKRHLETGKTETPKI